ncbi:hypothetical protein AciX9_3550 [Granulicella tundricola MP5ACTX9]|uniref:Uncharacterized protein n=1 Tax=Granulicella tundricola (strain ATCC BAA-1859 / DSM 23138 / MP5ACTX9) TaxID=1198114 RepID=E8X4R5_GRATM|nr:hypothetical protein AciX9_3550 [Granulicella tundricola MP5ACTX9]
MKTAITRKVGNKFGKLMVAGALMLSPALALAHPGTPETRIHTSPVHEHGVQIHSVHSSTIVHRS